MASRTDLGGFMRDDTPSLRSQLHAAIARGEFDKPWKALGHYQTLGTTSMPRVCEAQGEKLETQGIENLLIDLEEQIIAKVGHDPRGKLRVRIYEQKKSQTPNVDHTRILDVRMYSEEDENPAAVKAALVEERNENYRLRQILADANGRLVQMSEMFATMASSAMKNLSEVGTVRAQVATAGDAGNLNSAVGVLVLMLGLPMLREAFKLPDNVPLSQIVSMMMKRLQQAIHGTPKQIEAGRPSARELPELGEPGNVSSADEEADPSDDGSAEGLDLSELEPPAVDQVLVWLKADPAWGGRVYTAITADVPLMLLLKEHAP